MRNLPKLLFQRVVVVSLAILLQILFVIAGMDWLQRILALDEDRNGRDQVGRGADDHDRKKQSVV